MKNVAFVAALLIVGLGAFGILVPSGFVWIARHSVTPGAFFVAAAIRVALGLVLISASSDSRAPKTLRVLGSLILIAGIATALTGLVAMESARDAVEWWSEQGFGVFRLTAFLVMSLGGFLAYACAPSKARAVIP